MKNQKVNKADRYHHIGHLPRKDPDMVAARLRLLEKAKAHTSEADRIKLEAYKSRLFSMGYVSMEHVTRLMDESFRHYTRHPYEAPATEEELADLAECRHSVEEMEATLLLEIAGSPLERLVSLVWHVFNQMLHRELCDTERIADEINTPEPVSST